LKEGAIVPVQLNQNLRFGESMTDSRVNALVINLHAGEKEMMLDRYPEILYILVYGRDITGISVDGEVLPELEKKGLESLPPGWFRDTEMKRIVIRMPQGLSEKVELK
jgi:hypothetical protein